jgi:sialic acid synthase SpsE
MYLLLNTTLGTDSFDDIQCKMSKGQNYFYRKWKSIRPGFGIAPKLFEQVMGQVASYDIDKGEPLSMEDLE